MQRVEIRIGIWYKLRPNSGDRLKADRALYERLEPHVAAYYQQWDESSQIASPLVYRYNQI